MSGTATQVIAAREAFARGEWLAAQTQLEQARDAGELVGADLDLLSRATWFLGEVPESMDQAERAFASYIDDGQPLDAAGLGVRLALEWATRGDFAIATAWLGRARRLLRDVPANPTSGYLSYVEAFTDLDIEGDPVAAEAAAERVGALAAEFADPALACFARVLRGMAAIRRGRTSAGFDELDEAMLPVLAGQVDPLWGGDIYCTVIHICEGLGDLARMRAWTDSLDRWAAPLSDLFMYVGVTRIHQLQLLSAEGDWDVIEDELGARSQGLVRSHGWMAGAGYTELGDVRRLRGDLGGARQAYALARSLGVDPQPGEAHLLAATGQPVEALAALRASIGERGRLERARLLLPAAELAIETGGLEEALGLTVQLEETAGYFGTPGLQARADQARAALLIAQSRPAEALTHLEAAARVYRVQRFRHATARVHEQFALAHRDLGHAATAAAEGATALAIYQQLGAAPDVERLAGQADSPGSARPDLPGGLTAREAEVLACVVSGASNRDVAARLSISDKTVSRHLANIFLKLGVSSRTAAAAWAHDHGLDRSRPR